MHRLRLAFDDPGNKTPVVLGKAYVVRTEIENMRWKAERQQHLPNFLAFCHAQQLELMNVRKMWYFPSLLLVLFGFGHFLTKVGRKIWFICSYNYYMWLCVSLGVWSEDSVWCYDLATTVDMVNIGDIYMDENKQDGIDHKYKDFNSTISAILGTRAMLFQIIPQFAIVTLFVNRTSTTPLYFPPSIKSKARPIFNYEWSWKRAIEIEDHLFSGGDTILNHGRNWIISLRTIYVLITESRAINYTVGFTRRLPN